MPAGSVSRLDSTAKHNTRTGIPPTGTEESKSEITRRAGDRQIWRENRHLAALEH
jgi:hypothetical protein